MLQKWYEDYRRTNYVSIWKLCVSGGCGGAAAGMVWRPTLVWAGTGRLGVATSLSLLQDHRNVEGKKKILIDHTILSGMKQIVSGQKGTIRGH